MVDIAEIMYTRAQAGYALDIEGNVKVLHLATYLDAILTNL